MKFTEFLNENKDNYMLLGRLKSDCEYMLNHGGGSTRGLWAGNVKDQIEKMKELWNSFPKDKKPDWLSYEDIEKYEKDMNKCEDENK